MKCLKCDKEIGECKICPFCGYLRQAKNICKKCGKQGNAYFEGMCKECYDEMHGNKKEQENEENLDTDRTKFLFIFKIIMLILCIISTLIILIISKNIAITIILVIASTFLWVTLTIFETIIDLLQSINKKIRLSKEKL